MILSQTSGLGAKLWKTRFFLLSLAAGVFPFFLKPVYFMEPDDFLLNYIANGSYGFEGSQNLVFIRLPIGYILKGLYGITTQVNWYAALLVLFFVLSWTVVYDCVWACTGSRLSILAVFLPDLLLTYCFLTFTVAAYLAVLAGGIIICTAIVLRRGIAFRMAGIFFLYFGYCMRDDTLIPTLFILFPLGLYFLYLRYGTKDLPASFGDFFREWRIPVGILLVLLAATVLWEKAAYTRDGWEGYLEFTDGRGDAVDYPAVSYAYHADEFQEAGLDEIDYMMLIAWNFAEKDVFTAENMREVGRIEAHSVSTSKRVNYAKEQIDKKAVLLILFPVLVFLMLLLMHKNYPWLAGLCTVGCDLLMDAVLLFWRMRFVVRAALPLALAALVALVLLGYRKKYRHPVSGVLGILIFLLLPGTFYIREYLDSVAWMRQPYGMKVHSSLRKEIAEHPENLYIMDGGIMSGIYYYDHPVTKVLTTDTFSNIARSGSWDTYSVRYYRQAEKYLNDPDNLLSSLIREDHVFYVSFDQSVSKMKNFLEHHTGKTYKLTSIEYDDSQYEIYTFREGKKK